MGNLKHLIFGVILTALIAFLLINFVIVGGSENGIDTSKFQDEDLNLTGLNQTIYSIQENAEDWRDIFSQEGKLTLVDAGTILFDTPIAVLKTMFTSINVMFTIITQMFSSVLHIPVEIIHIILALLSIAFIFGLWKLLVSGE